MSDAVLDDEFLRATPGLRPFSVGILGLCRKLGLKLATGQAAAQEESAREVLTVAWLLDERHSIELIKRLSGDRAALALTLDEYEFALAPAFLMRVKAEIELTNRAVQAAAVEIVAKPGGHSGPEPPGNS